MTTKQFSIFLFLISNFFSFNQAQSQQTNMQNSRPLLFVKPIPLDWKSTKFQPINYKLEHLGEGAALYTLESDEALQFNLKIVLPSSIFAYNNKNISTFMSAIDMLILGGFGPYTYEQIQKQLDENAISLNTSMTSTGQIIVAAQGLSQDFDKTLKLVQQMLFSPKFDEKALEIWKQEKQDAYTSLLEANTLEKQMRFIDTEANILAFGINHFLSQKIRRRSYAEIKKINATEIKSLYKELFNQNGLQIWLAGKFTQKNKNSLSKLILKIPSFSPPVETWLPERSLGLYTSTLPGPGLDWDKDNPQHTPLNNFVYDKNGHIIIKQSLRRTNLNEQAKVTIKIPTVIIKKQDMTQCNVSLRYYFSKLGKLNSEEKIVFSILSEIFSSSGGVVGNDRFSKVMRADSGISYSPHAFFNEDILYPNTNLSAFYLNFQTPNGRLNEAVTLANNTWETFLSKGITQEELDFTRTAMMNRLLASELTVFNKSDAHMEDILKGHIPHHNPIEYRLARLDQIKNALSINQVLGDLNRGSSDPYLVIMGNPDKKEIQALAKNININLLKVVDFKDYSDQLK